MAQPAISKLSVGELKKEILRRERLVVRLQKARKQLAVKLARFDGQIAALLGAARSAGPRRAGRKRARNKMSLADVLAKVLSRKEPMAVRQAIEAVQAAGYKTTSKQFRVIVTQTLVRDKRFKRAKRGQYILKT